MAQIGRALGIPKGTLSPILRTMATEGFLEFHEATGEFSLGLKTYLAGKAFERRGGELAMIRGVMERVVDRCGETCQLASMDGQDALYLAKAESPAPVQLVTDVGKRMPLYCTAVGKALLSRLDAEELGQRLPPEFEARTRNTVRDREALAAQLDQVRSRGYAQEVGEVLDDVECFAVPVPIEGRVRYGLGVSTPRYRMDEQHRAAILEALREAQAELSHRL